MGDRPSDGEKQAMLGPPMTDAELEDLTGLDREAFDALSDAARRFSERVSAGDINPDAGVCPLCGERSRIEIEGRLFSFTCSGCGWQIAGLMRPRG